MELFIKNKRRGRKIINHHIVEGDKGIPSSCPWFATSTTRQASSWIANHGHSNGIPLSLPQCGDRFYYTLLTSTGSVWIPCARSLSRIERSGGFAQSHVWELQILDTRMGFHCPFRNVEIDSISQLHRRANPALELRPTVCPDSNGLTIHHGWIHSCRKHVTQMLWVTKLPTNVTCR